MQDIYDVIIVGAGIAGIGTACHISRECPDKKWVILERRAAIGGTWDLFRYPGIRCDTDTYTMAYKFRPWPDSKAIADGPSMRQYIADTAKEHGIDRNIQHGLRVIREEWSSKNRCWTVTAADEAGGVVRSIRGRILVNGTGYYDYDQGYLPEFSGAARFKGVRVHPQHWPQGLSYRGKQVVVIGSGATAATVVPAMAAEAAHVTLLQRSPSFYFSMPSRAWFSILLGPILPTSWVHALGKATYIGFFRLNYWLSRTMPRMTRLFVLARVRMALNADTDMVHFTPNYQPWDERVCIVPDGDLFKAVNSKKASVVTDEIQSFTETGIQLKSGRELAADIIVTATGLQVQALKGIELVVDGQSQSPGDLLTYKSVMLQDVPNMFWIFGYINASWTMKVDLAAAYICRLLKHLDRTGSSSAVPRAPKDAAGTGSMFNALSSGYVRRADGLIPRQGRQHPWRVVFNYPHDRKVLLEDPIEDGILEFASSPSTQASEETQTLAA